MNTGSYFGIGSSHIVCEDYAMHQPDAVILSDGCSNGYGPSIDADWGARFLCHLGLQYRYILNAFGEDNKKNFIQRVISHAIAACDTLNKNSDCLTASLLMAHQKGNSINTLRVGDGIVGAKYKDGHIIFSILEYNGNAPFYPIYAESPHTYGEFFEEYGSKVVVRQYYVEEDSENGWKNIKEDQSEWDCSQDPYETLSFKTDEVEFVFIGSDGWETFLKKISNITYKTTEGVSLPLVVRELIDFGNFNRNFVYHQCNWMLNLDKPGTFVRRGLYHTDDFSMGAIYCGK